MFKFKPLFETRECECCDGTGKSHIRIFKYDKKEAEIIRENFPKFDSKDSCENCFGDGNKIRFITDMSNREIVRHRFSRAFNREKRE